MGSSIRHLILTLWNGQFPLARAFWRYALIYGNLANLFATLLTLAAISAGVPGLLAAVIHFLPLPYNIIASVGVWRSAAGYAGNPLWAAMARIVIVLWAIVATLA